MKTKHSIFILLALLIALPAFGQTVETFHRGLLPNGVVYSINKIRVTCVDPAPSNNKFLKGHGNAPPTWETITIPAEQDLVTLTGENYLSLSGQEITVGAVDLSGSNVTGVLPAANGGTGTFKTEVPSGTQNSINTAFTLSQTPISDTTTDLQGFKNGMFLNPFSNYGSPDYTISGTTVTYLIAPAPTDVIIFKYRY